MKFNQWKNWSSWETDSHLENLSYLFRHNTGALRYLVDIHNPALGVLHGQPDGVPHAIQVHSRHRVSSRPPQEELPLGRAAGRDRRICCQRCKNENFVTFMFWLFAVYKPPLLVISSNAMRNFNIFAWTGTSNHINPYQIACAAHSRVLFTETSVTNKNRIILWRHLGVNRLLEKTFV